MSKSEGLTVTVPFKLENERNSGAQRPYFSGNSHAGRNSGAQHPYFTKNLPAGRNSGAQHPYFTKNPLAGRNSGAQHPYFSRNPLAERNSGVVDSISQSDCPVPRAKRKLKISKMNDILLLLKPPNIG
ncbi:hypothetical protein [Cohnella herbarum]|uniref:Uncharacterized protein n=1 Tax=Cohnella herbarum TaxID=2728023 RepID=A0A7Z2ZPJ1_9BACL|nr:hypothetical protein [Cohnella herbarum]QJD87428.1 hypothetical protein HH215_32460 [Cohnella herbarum]